jgi:hypothetical protein
MVCTTALVRASTTTSWFVFRAAMYTSCRSESKAMPRASLPIEKVARTVLVDPSITVILSTPPWVTKMRFVRRSTATMNGSGSTST